MTSTLKLGLAGLTIVGVGLGAYLVNHGLKENRVAKNTANDTSAVARTETEQASPAPGTPEVKLAQVAPTAADAVTTTDGNTGRAASPKPLGVGDTSDIERSWRSSQPLQTKESPVAPPTLPGTASSETGHTETPSVVTPPTAAAEPKTGTPVISTPPLPPVGIDSDRMSLSAPPTTQPSVAGASTAPKAPTPTTGPEKMTIHVVQAGETFSGLAAKYLGSPKNANLIEKANPKINPNRLYVGTKLKIPAAPPAAAPATNTGTPNPAVAANAPKAKVTAPPVDPAKAYTVKAGDSWSALGRRFLGNGDSWTLIYEHNKERFAGNSRTLRPGMVLEIPAKEAAAPTKETAAPKK